VSACAAAEGRAVDKPTARVRTTAEIRAAVEIPRKEWNMRRELMAPP
jgi:hypothetical protein